MNNILGSKKIDHDLQHKIIMYLNYVWKEEETEKAEKRLNFVEKLSGNLREEYLLQTHGRTLRKCQIISKNFSEDSLKGLVHLMTAQKYAENEIILEVVARNILIYRFKVNIHFFQKKGEMDDDKIYIINQGVIELYLDCKKLGKPTSIKRLKVFT